DRASRMSEANEPTSPHYLPDHSGQPDWLWDHHSAAALLRADVWRLAADDRPAVRVVLVLAADRVAAARPLVRHMGPASRAHLQPARHRRQLRDACDGAESRDAVRGAHRRRP